MRPCREATTRKHTRRYVTDAARDATAAECHWFSGYVQQYKFFSSLLVAAEFNPGEMVQQWQAPAAW